MSGYFIILVLIVYVILITLITFDVRTVKENSFLNKLTSTPKGVPVGNCRGLKIKTSGKCHKLSGKNHYKKLFVNAQPTTPNAHCWFLVIAMLVHGCHNIAEFVMVGA